MNTSVIIEVPIPITMLSDEQILAEINRRHLLIKWARKPAKAQESKPKDWVKLGLSPSTIVEDWN
jgi:hypothetical protein